MAKVVVTAPPKHARPAPKRSVHQPTPKPPEEAAPPSAPEEPSHPSPAEVLSEAEAIEQRLRDGLSGVESKRAEHQAVLDRIAEDLAALPGKIEAAEALLSRLQQEAALLPRRLNAARAVLVGALGTKAEVEAQAQLAAQEARGQTLPPDLEEAEQAARETRAACSASQARLEQEQVEHQAALADLAEFAKALQDEASKARRRIAEAVYASIEVEQQQRQSLLDTAEASVAEARAALSALAEEAKTRLQQTAPDLLLQFQAAHVPVQDAVTERLEAVLVYRRALLAWQKSGSYWLTFPVYWFPFRDVELGMPDIQGMFIGEIEQALRQHVSKQQQRIR